MQPEISVEELSLRLANGKPSSMRLIDCRELDEWQINRIEGAELLPLSRFAEEAQSKLGDQEQEIVVYCHHGMRSLRVTMWLRQQGFSKAQSMAGGIDAWADRIDPEMPKY